MAGPSRPITVFQTTSSLKPLGQFQLDFICSLLTMKEQKVCLNGPGHMTKMDVMPKYGKYIKKSPEPLGRLP